MAGVNKVILVGNLGKDPEVRSLEGGRKVANLSLATSETFKDREGNRQERTEWHRLTVWGPLAEVAEKYLRKGSQIYAEGKLRTREYEQDGQKKYATDVMVDTFTMLGSRGDNQGDGGSQGGSGYNSGGNYGGGGNQGGGYNSGGNSGQSSNQGSTSRPALNDPEPDDLPF